MVGTKRLADFNLTFNIKRPEPAPVAKKPAAPATRPATAG